MEWEMTGRNVQPPASTENLAIVQIPKAQCQSQSSCQNSQDEHKKKNYPQCTPCIYSVHYISSFLVAVILSAQLTRWCVKNEFNEMHEMPMCWRICATLEKGGGVGGPPPGNFEHFQFGALWWNLGALLCKKKQPLKRKNYNMRRHFVIYHPLILGLYIILFYF